MTISYVFSCACISPDQLTGFFEGWPNPPSVHVHLRLLTKSDEVILAINETGQVVGFITAITDRVLAAYIPFLEVLPEYRGQGIGKELVRRMLERLKDCYMIDLLCDVGLQNFYSQIGMRPATGMMIRNYACQSGTSGQ